MRPNSLFIYHSLLTFDRIFTCFYAVLEWILFIFKGYNFPIERNSISVEIVCILFYFSINLLRIYCGEFGNRSETSLFVILSIAFVVGAFYTHFFFIFMSTYVLNIEIIINSFGLCLSFLETVFGVIAVMRIMGQEVSL